MPSKTSKKKPVAALPTIPKELIDQIVEALSDRSVQIAEVANGRLLYAGRPGGLLHGPRSPKYGADSKP